MSRDPKNLRILVLRENWLGCTGLSGFRAFLRLGCWADSVTEQDLIPLGYRSFLMKAMAVLMRPWAVREFNRSVLAKIDEIRPHLFVAFKGQFLQASTIREIKKRDTRAFCFFPDVSLFAHGKYLPQTVGQYDWVFTTKSFGPQDLDRKLGYTACSYLPHAFDPEVHRPRVPSEEDRVRFGCDVSFIGTPSAKKISMLEGLLRKMPGLNLKIWGGLWERLSQSSPLRKHVAFQLINGIGYATAIGCSRINLGLLSEQVPGASSGDHITSRTFHIPASGGLMLHERTSDLLTFFEEDKHCACFEGGDELADKIAWLLRSPEVAARIAADGQ